MPGPGATPQEKRLYDLIRKRTLACQMADARLERTQVTIHMDGDDTAHFTAQGEVVKFDGFLRVYRESRENDESAEDEALLPAMTEGMRLLPSDINARQSFTKPPQRYSEASLVHKMEELGIGRPSTYTTRTKPAPRAFHPSAAWTRRARARSPWRPPRPCRWSRR